MTNSTLIEKNKQKLLQEKQRLEKLLGRVAGFPNIGDDEEDNAAEVEQYEANLAEESDLEPKLVRVSAALERIASGTYGICKIGGEPIPEERLVAVPEAENCVQHEPR